MRIGPPIAEAEMIATFLRAEFASERFGSDLLAALQRDRRAPAVVIDPDLDDPQQNAYRRHLLGAVRGYGQNRALFETFPPHVVWQRVWLTPAELLDVQYIDYSYWNELSNGTRSPREGAKAVQSGRAIFGMPTDGIVRIVEALRAGAVFPELILVGTAADQPLVVLEGHVRLTVYALAPELIPSDLSAILGTAPEFAGWASDGAGERTGSTG